MNPMEEYKKPLTKEFSLGEHKVLISALSAKELNEAEKEISFNTIKNTNNEIEFRKIAILSRSIISIDNVLIKDFDNIQLEVSKNKKDLIKAIQDELLTYDKSVINILYGFYLKTDNENDKKFQKEINFLLSQD